MASITREEVAKRAHQAMGGLARDLTTAPRGDEIEGDYTKPINDALLDCGFDAISEANTHAKIRAVLRGAEYYVLRRLYRTRASEITSQQGAGASGMHLSIDHGQALGSLRLHLAMTREDYVEALTAIGRSLGADPANLGGGRVVQIDDADDKSRMLVDASLGLPWYAEGYHEIDH